MKTQIGLLSFLALFWVGQVSHAAEVRGQVLDALTDEPLEGVNVGLDVDGDSQPDFSTQTGAFGFYHLEGVGSGIFSLTGQHPGYLDHNEEVELVGDDRQTVSFKMIQRFPGETVFDIVIETLDVRTEVKLWQIPVIVHYFASETQSEPTRVYDDLLTDVYGATSILGARPGFYSFIFNRENSARTVRPYWEEFAASGRTRIDQHHAVTARLKPIGQDIDIHVIGCDVTVWDPIDPAAAERRLCRGNGD